MQFLKTLTPENIILLGLLGAGLFALGFAIRPLVQKLRGKKSFPEEARRTSRAIARANDAERERIQRIYNLISSLTATLNYQRVMDSALDLSASALSDHHAPVDPLVSAVMLFVPPAQGHQAQLTVVASRRFTPADARSVFPGAKGLLSTIFEEGQPVLATDLTQDPELGRLVTLRACKVAYCVPLRRGLNNYGILLYAHPDARYFTPTRCEIIDIIAHQAVIAIQNAILYRDLEQEKERMAELQEEARNKLARDLHDGPTQSIAAISMRLNFARRLLERDPKAAAEELAKIEDLARRTTAEIRHMLFTLRPLVLESQGLVAALGTMADKMRDTYNQNVILQADAEIATKLENAKQAIIFYIAEEAVTNARKHAQAAHIWLRLQPMEEGMAVLEIEDDGVGFNVGAVDSTYEKRGSLGLVNIRERAELVNGVWQIDSAEGKGTRIRVIIPMTDEAAERLSRGG